MKSTAHRAKAPGKKKSASKEASGKRRAAGRGGAKRVVSRRRSAPRKASTRKSSKLGRAAVVVGGAVAGVAVARRLSKRSPNDALALLERDHRQLEELLRRAEDTTPTAVAGRLGLLDRITSELALHEKIEEQVFYPALRQHPEAKDLVLEGFEEHHAADVAVRELRGLPPGAEQWGPKLKVLQEMIQHHIDEEEGEMFKTARAVFGRGELAALGRQMAAIKAQAQA